MPKQDRGAPARPPWLPEDDEQRGFLRSLRRKKRNAGEDESNEDSLTDETERPSTAQVPAQKSIAETSREEHAPESTAEEKANGAKPVPDVSKYYTPPRPPDPVEEASPEHDWSAIVQSPVSETPRIIASSIPEMKPEPRPIPQVEQPSSPPIAESPAIAEPEAVVPEAEPVVESVTPITVESEPPVKTPEEAPVSTEPSSASVESEVARTPAAVGEHSGPESGGADPFSRFSLLEAQLRQMSLDESITDDELERHRRHTRLECESEQGSVPETPTTLSFTPPEAVQHVPEIAEEVAQGAEETQEPELSFTSPEAVDQAPEAVEAEQSAPAEPEPVAVTDEPAAASVEPEPEAPTQEAAAEVDDAEARAAALLQRIEAKRAELNEELAAHDAAQEQASAPEPEAAPFVPMVAPWAAVPMVEEAATVGSESAESTIGADETAASDTSELGGFEPLVDEGIVIAAPPVVYDDLPDVAVLEDEVVPEPELASEPVAPTAHVVDPEPVGEIVDPTAESPQAVPAAEVLEQAAPELAAASLPPTPEPPGDGAVPEEAAEEDEAHHQPAYYVPPVVPPQAGPAPQLPASPSPEQQQPAAQVPPGWNPRPPYPGQWSQGAPQAPEPYGGQKLPLQPPPQPTSVQGQWQWVPQQQGLQPPGQQEPPEGYVSQHQGAAPPANYRAPQAYRMPPSLDEAEVINRGRYAPRSGWRKAVHRSTGGRVNPGDSRKDREQDQLLASIRQPILGDYRIAVLSIKGGVGKTTTTLGLGSAFATIRTDRIIAVDANPDRGTLAERVRDHSTQSTVRDLLNDQNIRSYADVRNHTRMATSRLEVLASEQDPAVSEAFGEVDYRNTIDILQRYYNIILTDCGTGIMHSAMAGVLDLAHTIVLVSSPAMDSARSASATLDWLMQHGHAGLVREAHVVLSASRPGSAGIKLDKVYEHFQARCRSIHMIPFDPHLAEGADVDFNLLNADTNAAYLKLAGAISESFPRLRMRGDEQQ
ncbi:MinD-like ATPase involved in chromosome partitioning or flagellar assembly [Mycobacteroides chelonae]|nr:MinD-like ATPase involved in chromosome partitioning or flagellar assembly [Mycobacteroides chelonae]